MSLLSPELTDQEFLARRATQLKASPRNLTVKMFQHWMKSFNMLWDTNRSITPAQKLEALGTDAAELFELNAAFVTFMVTHLTGKRDDLVQAIQEKVASIPPHTVNADGTVTLD
jgi:hypothetical protein